MVAARAAQSKLTLVLVLAPVLVLQTVPGY